MQNSPCQFINEAINVYVCLLYYFEKLTADIQFNLFRQTAPFLW
jgi:hypothetical protein